MGANDEAANVPPQAKGSWTSFLKVGGEGTEREDCF